MATNTTGKVIRKGKRLSIREASPDDPIYTRGYVIGGRHSRSSSKPTPPTPKSTEPPGESSTKKS